MKTYRLSMSNGEKDERRWGLPYALSRGAHFSSHSPDKRGILILKYDILVVIL